ncbi:hypothetical protein TVAG_183810 [Trichomonas vaginalis G3]|uniref:Uncharacterized protein n=1 Tax=Trichomonas vaginalis (strain ATCC PRA-98 / G3) TaxID=412133 RepID=A2D9B8_TRIV3|nr:hypothetical protein TVAGG3_0770380 [Trichomonas vaginalis G3]EAY23144.1 hypothetical protein TVAG_183810 [Trichomonas vaginalis G3]KAI5513789.1 hypothetical protein TVAGG3_0770380 [Trichomonas vaginalis G3]|eukprot:XP_001584130.1 hypothetical protein [Trichomonas vaginalis G3]
MNDNKLSVSNCVFANNTQGPDSLFGTYTSSSVITVTNSQIITNYTTMHLGQGTFSIQDPTIPDIVLHLLATDLCPTGEFLFGNATMKPTSYETTEMNLRNENDKYLYIILPAMFD